MVSSGGKKIEELCTRGGRCGQYGVEMQAEATMSQRSGSMFQQLRQLLGDETGGEQTDPALLDRFVQAQDQTAFAELVRRHGPIVWAACRRVLDDGHAAEDAFQATFMVLVRKAGSISRRELLGNWLYGVAFRIARKARGAAARRRSREGQVIDVPTPPPEDMRDLRLVVDDEVNRLPDRYRLPIVLCYFQGKAYEEAARLLGCPAGTVSGRLARARELLRERLARRGLGLSLGLLSTFLAQHGTAALPSGLLHSTLTHAAHFTADASAASALPAPVAAMTEGMLRAMFWNRAMIAGVVMISLTAVAGASLLLHAPVAEAPRPVAAPADQRALPPRLSAKPARLLPQRSLDLQTLAFSPDGQRLATGGDHLIRIWDTVSGRLLQEVEASPVGVAITRLAFAPDGRTLASLGGHGDINLRVWDASNGKLVRTAKLPGMSGVFCLQYSPDGKLIATARHEKGTLCLLDAATFEPVRDIVGVRPGCEAAFSPDGKWIAMVDARSRAGIWEVATGKLHRDLALTVGALAGGRPLAFTADSKAIVVAEQHKSNVVVFDVENGKEQQRFGDGKAGAISSIAVSLNQLAVQDARSLKVWDLKTGVELGQANSSTGRCPIAFAPGGRQLAVTWPMKGEKGPQMAAALFTIEADAPRQPPATEKEIAALWADLAATDATTAMHAYNHLLAAPAQTVPFLVKTVKLQPADPGAAEGQRLAALVADLASEEFATRERASRDLAKAGEAAEGALYDALATKPPLEVRKRVDSLLDRISQRPLQSDERRISRAIAALEELKSPEARQALQKLRGPHPRCRLGEEAQAALHRLDQVR